MDRPQQYLKCAPLLVAWDYLGAPLRPPSDCVMVVEPADQARRCLGLIPVEEVCGDEDFLEGRHRGAHPYPPLGEALQGDGTHP